MFHAPVLIQAKRARKGDVDVDSVFPSRAHSHTPSDDGEALKDLVEEDVDLLMGDAEDEEEHTPR